MLVLLIGFEVLPTVEWVKYKRMSGLVFAEIGCLDWMANFVKVIGPCKVYEDGDVLCLQLLSSSAVR